MQQMPQFDFEKLFKLKLIEGEMKEHFDTSFWFDFWSPWTVHSRPPFLLSGLCLFTFHWGYILFITKAGFKPGSLWWRNLQTVPQLPIRFLFIVVPWPLYFRPFLQVVLEPMTLPRKRATNRPWPTIASAWPDIGIKSSTIFSKSGPKRSLRQFFVTFSKRPKKLTNIWNIFGSEFDAKMLKNRLILSHWLASTLSA